MPGCFEQLKSGYNSMPLFNKYLMTFCIFLFLLSFVLPMVIYYMIMIPSEVVKLQGK